MDEQPSERDLGYTEGALRAAFKSADEIAGLRAENARLRASLAATGGLAMLAQCPSCLAERTNGERHDDGCPLVAPLPCLPEVITVLEQSLTSWQQLARRRAKLLETIRDDLASEAFLQAPRQRAYQLVEIICRDLGD